MPNTIWQDALSRSILDLVEDKAKIGSWSWNLEDNTLDWSIGVYRILGLPPSQPPSLETLAGQIEGSDAAMLLLSNRLVVARFLADRKLTIRRKDGEVRTLHSHGKLVAANDGTQSQFVGAFLDITESRVEDELFLLREAIIDSMSHLFEVSIWQTDAAGASADLLQWRSGAKSIGGAAPWNQLDQLQSDDAEHVQAAWKDALQSLQGFFVRYRLMSGGQEHFIESRAVPLLSGAGELRGWIGYTRDQLAKPVHDNTDLDSALVRAARGLLDWTGRELAARAGVSFSTVRRLETAGPSGLSKSSLSAIEQAFAQAGVSFRKASDGGRGVFQTEP